MRDLEERYGLSLGQEEKPHRYILHKAARSQRVVSLCDDDDDDDEFCFIPIRG